MYIYIYWSQNIHSLYKTCKPHIYTYQFPIKIVSSVRWSSIKTWQNRSRSFLNVSINIVYLDSDFLNILKNGTTIYDVISTSAYITCKSNSKPQYDHTVYLFIKLTSLDLCQQYAQELKNIFGDNQEALVMCEYALNFNVNGAQKMKPNAIASSKHKTMYNKLISTWFRE